ncbi:ATP-dependent DNA ligase [Mesorhizobium onobrychidis]|uniref:ATP-dependent DNA ligase n=1 Tax=Mesorhizobium onobrychidis TaxID=2775404 RepID=UPI00215783C0|nr:hypothetical protein [Mesorhizobium onobrychidis]
MFRLAFQQELTERKRLSAIESNSSFAWGVPMSKRAGDRLEFIEPLLPTLVEKPPEGGDWIHEVKFDGYRSQIVIDDEGVRIFTRRGLDWKAKYRDLTAAAKLLGVESAIIDGEIIVLNEAGLSDFRALRSAITRRQHDLYFVAFDGREP